MYSELGRYIPGSVWHIACRVDLGCRSGASPQVTLTVTLLELFLVAMTAVCWGAPAMLRTLFVARPFTWSLLALGVTVLPFVVHPRVVSWVVGIVDSRSKQSRSSFHMPWRNTLLLLGLCALMWVVNGIGFAEFADSMRPRCCTDSIGLIEAYASAWFLGLVCLFAPAGIGIREAVLAASLGRLMNPIDAALIAVSLRLWSTIIELFWVACAWAQLQDIRHLPGLLRKATASTAYSKPADLGGLLPDSRGGKL